MEAVVARLEAVAERLERAEARLSTDVAAAAPPSAAPNAPSASKRAPAAPSPPAAASVASPSFDAAAAAASPSSGAAAYAATVLPAAAALRAAAEAVGSPELLSATEVFVGGIESEASVTRALDACRKPGSPASAPSPQLGAPQSSASFQALISPAAAALTEAASLPSKAPPRSPLTDHLRALAEASQALAWVALPLGAGEPAGQVAAARDAADYHLVRVLRAYRAEHPEHAAWAQALKAAVKAVEVYCSAHHAGGMTWTGQADLDRWVQEGGAEAAKVEPGASEPTQVAPKPEPALASTPAPVPKPKPTREGPPPPPPPPPKGSLNAPRGAPPPPPPPPKGSLTRPREGGSASGGAATPPTTGMAALLAELSVGDGASSRLRKVTADMKTKNDPNRPSGIVRAAGEGGAAAGASAPAKAPGAGAGGAKAPPRRVELEQGRKWVVQGLVNEQVEVTDTDPRHSVYVYGCRGSTVSIRGKVSAISVDACSKVGVAFDGVVAGVEAVRCAGVELQCVRGAVGTVSLDGCDGAKVYLQTEVARNAQIATAKCSEVNLIVYDEGADAEPLESPVPEQFISTFDGTAWVTKPAAHSGA